MPATATRNRISGLIEEADAEHEADLADAKAKLDALRAADDAVFDTPPAAIVTGYDSNGEARDFEVSNIHHEPEPLTTASASSLPGFQGFVSQSPMPGFEGHTADVVVVNFNGRLELNLQNARERRLWDDLAWGARVALEVTGVVIDKKYHLALDKDGEDKRRTAGASIKVFDLFRVAGDELTVEEEEKLNEMLNSSTDDDLHAASRAYNLSDALADVADLPADDAPETDEE